MNTRSKGKGDHGVLGGASAVGHVLPDDHAEAVAGVIPARRLHLDVLADHIAANLFGIRDVEKHGFLRRRGIKPLGEVALVQGTELKDRFIIEREAPEAFFVAHLAIFSHAKVASHLIDYHSVNFQS